VALAGHRLEFPAVVATFEMMPVEPTFRERHAAMGATIAQRKWTSLGIAPQHQRDAEQHNRLQPALAHTFSAQRGIPEPAQQAVVTATRFGHGPIPIIAEIAEIAGIAVVWVSAVGFGDPGDHGDFGDTSAAMLD
jgi:hypothetical protein